MLILGGCRKWEHQNYSVERWLSASLVRKWREQIITTRGYSHLLPVTQFWLTASCFRGVILVNFPCNEWRVGAIETLHSCESGRWPQHRQFWLVTPISLQLQHTGPVFFGVCFEARGVCVVIVCLCADQHLHGCIFLCIYIIKIKQTVGRWQQQPSQTHLLIIWFKRHLWWWMFSLEFSQTLAVKLIQMKTLFTL